jgi:copper transport protein
VSRPEHIIDPATAMWGWGIPLATVAAAALTRVEGSLAALGYLVNVVHLLAAGVWVGGAALVSRVVLAGPGEDDLVQATRAFSKVSMPAIVVVSVTGIFQVWRLDGADLFGSNHGRVLLLKVIVVAVMLAVALAARQQVTMRLDRAHELTAPLADRFKRAFGTEAALGVVVLAFSGWMLTLTPPKVDPLANEVFLDAMVFVHAPPGLDATVRVGPGLAGPTGLRVDVESPDEGISRLLLRFIPPENSGAFIVEQEIPLTGAGTAYLDDSIGLPLNAAGVWTLELSASTATGVLENARYTFELRLPDGTQVTTTAPQVTVDVNISIVEQTTTTAPFATTTAAPTTVP